MTAPVVDMARWMLSAQAGRRVCAVLLGILLDRLFGDPEWFFHPVRLMGGLIVFLEKILRIIFPRNKSGERAAGVALVILTLAPCVSLPLALLGLLYSWNFWAGFALEGFFCYQLMAAKSLRMESMKVCRALQEGSLAEAREAVSRIVGRDVDRLDEAGVARAAVETVAENASDGVIAPLFYLMLGGAVLGFAYKAVNTLDSMTGYKNERYRYFGTAAAKLDDAANFVPARISGVLLSGAAALAGGDWRNAWRIFIRDRRNHDSPNSAQPEAAMAGALGIRLGGDAWYFGVQKKKPWIGDVSREIEPADILRANRLMYRAEVLAFLAFLPLPVLWYGVSGIFFSVGFPV